MSLFRAKAAQKVLPSLLATLIVAPLLIETSANSADVSATFSLKQQIDRAPSTLRRPLNDDSPQAMPLAPEQEHRRSIGESSHNASAPDSSSEIELAWDAWHNRISTVIEARFNFFAKAAFRRSPPLLCEISYTVTADGHIQGVDLRKKSSNNLYNVLVVQTIKSIDGDRELLKFPPGSRRKVVTKYGIFRHGSSIKELSAGPHEDVQEYIRLMESGHIDEAVRLWEREHPE